MFRRTPTPDLVDDTLNPPPGYPHAEWQDAGPWAVPEALRVDYAAAPALDDGTTARILTPTGRTTQIVPGSPVDEDAWRTLPALDPYRSMPGVEFRPIVRGGWCTAVEVIVAGRDGIATATHVSRLTAARTAVAERAREAEIAERNATTCPACGDPLSASALVRTATPAGPVLVCPACTPLVRRAVETAIADRDVDRAIAVDRFAERLVAGTAG